MIFKPVASDSSKESSPRSPRSPVGPPPPDMAHDVVRLRDLEGDKRKYSARQHFARGFGSYGRGQHERGISTVSESTATTAEDLPAPMAEHTVSPLMEDELRARWR